MVASAKFKGVVEGVAAAAFLLLGPCNALGAVHVAEVKEGLEGAQAAQQDHQWADDAPPQRLQAQAANRALHAQIEASVIKALLNAVRADAHAPGDLFNSEVGAGQHQRFELTTRKAGIQVPAPPIYFNSVLHVGSSSVGFPLGPAAKAKQ